MILFRRKPGGMGRIHVAQTLASKGAPFVKARGTDLPDHQVQITIGTGVNGDHYMATLNTTEAARLARELQQAVAIHAEREERLQAVARASTGRRS